MHHAQPVSYNPPRKSPPMPREDRVETREHKPSGTASIVTTLLLHKDKRPELEAKRCPPLSMFSIPENKVADFSAYHSVATTTQHALGVSTEKVYEMAIRKMQLLNGGPQLSSAQRKTGKPSLRQCVTVRNQLKVCQEELHRETSRYTDSEGDLVVEQDSGKRRMLFDVFLKRCSR